MNESICIYRVLTRGDRDRCYSVLNSFPKSKNKEIIIEYEDEFYTTSLLFTGDCKNSNEFIHLGKLAKELEIEIYINYLDIDDINFTCTDDIKQYKQKIKELSDNIVYEGYCYDGNIINHLDMDIADQIGIPLESHFPM